MTCIYPPLFGEELCPERLPDVSGYVREETLVRRAGPGALRESLWAASAGQQSWDSASTGTLSKSTVIG